MSIGAEDASGQSAAGVPVAEGDGAVARLVVGVVLRDGGNEAGTSGERGCVEALCVLQRAKLAVATVLSPNQARELLVQGLVVQAQALQGAGTQGGHEDVGLGQEVEHNFLALGVLAVDGGPFLVEGTAVVCNVVKLGAEAHAPCEALGALLVAGEGLDLDDRGAHLGQRAGSGRASSILGEVDNDGTFQTCHVISPLFVGRLRPKSGKPPCLTATGPSLAAGTRVFNDGTLSPRTRVKPYGSRTTRRPSPDSMNSMPLRHSDSGTTMLEIREMSKPLASRFRACFQFLRV